MRWNFIGGKIRLQISGILRYAFTNFVCTLPLLPIFSFPSAPLISPSLRPTPLSSSLYLISYTCFPLSIFSSLFIFAPFLLISLFFPPVFSSPFHLYLHATVLLRILSTFTLALLPSIPLFPSTFLPLPLTFCPLISSFLFPILFSSSKPSHPSLSFLFYFFTTPSHLPLLSPLFRPPAFYSTFFFSSSHHSPITLHHHQQMRCSPPV